VVAKKLGHWTVSKITERLNSSGSGNKSVACFCKHSKELLGSIKGGEFLDFVRDYFVSQGLVLIYCPVIETISV
jgi:hypothetical protein